jgi:transcriptional regulator with XRE-family HTH domain
VTIVTPQEGRTVVETKDVGAIIRRYRANRLPKKMTQEELGRLVGVSRSLVARWESGERTPTAEEAVKVADVLGFAPDDRERLYRLLGIADVAVEYHRGETDVRWQDAGVDALRRTIRRLTSLQYPAEMLWDWGRARLYIGRFAVDQALPLLQPVAAWAEEDATGELGDIILLDLADAYAIAGQLPEADARSAAAAEHSRGLLDQKRSKRHRMAVGRALVMRQEVAYERGDEDACWQFHDEAKPHLEQAEDAYGLAKSFFFLSLFRFWQGRLPEALDLALHAKQQAQSVGAKFDAWWALRDGFFLGNPWWRAITSSLLLDVRACLGQGETLEFDRELFRHRRLHHRFMPDFPPFVPRYLWLTDPTTEGVDRFGTDLGQWVQETKRRGCFHLHTDLLLSYGDFLRVARGDRAAADRTYEDALAVARDPGRGYDLLATAAARRLAGEQVFPGLAGFASAHPSGASSSD